VTAERVAEPRESVPAAVSVLTREQIERLPAENLAALSDQDIKDLFAYLQSLAPVHNRVPAPIDPPEGQQ